ncbi:MAG: DUF937 domain-containing protein [Anaerorhabdus sp.]
MDLNTIVKMLGDGATNELKEKTGASSNQISDLMSNALPTILSAMQNNAKDDAGAASLSKALDDHANDDISDIGAFLKNVDVNDGAKILSKVFGSEDKNIQSQLAEKSGLSADQVSTSLASLAPLLLSFLGKQKKQSSGNDVMSMIGGLMGGANSDMAQTLLKGVKGFFK